MLKQVTNNNKIQLKKRPKKPISSKRGPKTQREELQPQKERKTGLQVDHAVLNYCRQWGSTGEVLKIVAEHDHKRPK